MASPSTDPTLQLETDARMIQALEQFFQRHAGLIETGILREMPHMMSPSGIRMVQTCLDALKFQPDTLSTAFAHAFKAHLDHAGATNIPQAERWQLMDDAMLDRELAIKHCVSKLHSPLFQEISALDYRMTRVSGVQSVPDANHSRYAPTAIVTSLSTALDQLSWESYSGSFLIRQCGASLLETLKQTYGTLNGFLEAHGVTLTGMDDPVHNPQIVPTPDQDGQAIFDFLQQTRKKAQTVGEENSNAHQMTGSKDHSFDAFTLHTLAGAWKPTEPVHLDPAGVTVPRVVLHELAEAMHAHPQIEAFDLRVLNAVTQLFEALLSEATITPEYLAWIAQLQVPVLRVALESPTFFSDEAHPARRLIDLLGTFSRNFPETSSRYHDALRMVERACDPVIHDAEHRPETFARSHDSLAAWMEAENRVTLDRLAEQKTALMASEQRELGTLLALETLGDLTERYPAPEAVLRQLETAWVPHMVALYVEETGEGPAWREAGRTLLKLFQSMQPPVNVIDRAEKLRGLPELNGALRQGLTQEGAKPEQLREFFMAITARQECWIRPEMGENAPLTSAFVPQSRPREELEALAQLVEDNDPHLEQASQLREGDWVDFNPPFHGMDSARVAWVGLQGYLLFCDDHGDQRFSTDTTLLAAELRAGHATIVDLALTRKAMLRVREALVTAD